MDARSESQETASYHYEGGIKEYIEYMNKDKDVLFEQPIYLEDEQDGIELEVALQYTDGFHSNILSFANNIHTFEGGMHESGAKTALTRD